MEALGTPGRFFIFLIFVWRTCLVFSDDCKFGKYDLSEIQGFSPWHVRNDVINATLAISLCSKLDQDVSNAGNKCPDNTAVCAHYDDGRAVSFGQYSSIHKGDSSTEGENAELMVMLKGEKCPDSDLDTYTSIFYFKCGKTLGHPRHLGDFPCITHFEWESYVFCEDIHVPDKEVPCTVTNENKGHMIDLSPLTKLTGAYLVDAADATHHSRIYINVCRDISPGTLAEDPLKNCPKGAGSCQIVGDQANNLGEPTTKLEATEDGAKLVYTLKEKPPNSLEAPTTTINFRCPERGGSKDPVLLTDFLSSIEIDWVTEYACPVKSVISNSCKLTMAQHNIDIDLSPLKQAQLHPYVVNVTEDGDQYEYFINVCESLGSSCGKAIPGMSSVCQRKKGTQDSWSAGEKRFTTLRYSDNQLTMEMKNGDSCHTNFRRTTVIDFLCNKTAVNDGQGYPKFVNQDQCSYFFVWDTKYACVEATIDDTCAVEADGKKFDLSSLVREKGENWEVITGENEEDGLTYYLNICHDVLQTDATKNCPQGAAICATTTGSDVATSLGSYKKALSYEETSKSLRLVYTDGSKTSSNCVRKTTINLFCSPGNVESAPRLVHRSEDNCLHEIEWHTSAACVVSRKTGTDCKVYDDQLGFTFDLNPLKKDAGYSVMGGDDYQYWINVCDAVKHDTYCHSTPHDNAAICQINMKGSKEQVKIASPSTKLEYFDGVLNLTYTGGEPYRDPNHTPRKAEIAFICDMAAGAGSPKFLEEKEFTYSFEWRTHYACPTLPIECAVTDDKTHKQYDLSSLAKLTENWQVENREDPDNIKRFYINVCRPVVPVASCSPFGSVCATNIDKNGKETLYHGNLGRSESAPEVEKYITGVKLTYTNGGLCKAADGSDENFKTSIHFDCVPGKVAGGPNSVKLINPCEYAILWETEAACAIDSVTNFDTNKTDCSVKDPNSDFIFHLSPLAKEGGYSVTAGSKSYKLNICDTLPEDTCGKLDNKYASSVCEIGTDNKGSPKASLEGSSLEYSSQGEMTLTYRGEFSSVSGAQETYVLNFFCDQKAQSPVIVFDSEDAMSTTFKVNTALACAPKPVSCVVEDSKGQQFDLSSLAREGDNWVVIDTREKHSDLRYHINVCRPVNPTKDMTCPGGAVGGCQTNAGGDLSFNMGYVQSEPVLSNGSEAITLHYEGGDKCHVGKETESFRSTRIIFFCDVTEHGPVFHAESDTCEYIFFWRTPSACAQQIVTGSDCKVTDPLYNYEFDLNPLRKASDHYTVLGAGYKFLLNVCGNLNGAPEPCSDAHTGACQTDGGLTTPIVAGQYNAQPEYNSGVISLTYAGGKDKCHGQYERSTVIDFVCHHDQSGDAGPRYLDEKADCTYAFEWPTKAACPPHQVTDCVLQEGDKTFDLTRLSKADGNYERAYNSSNEIFILNVCRSLVHKKGQTCPTDSAACRIDMSEKDPKKRFHSLGEVTNHSLTYQKESEVLVLKYENGETCGEKKRRSTVILFSCDKSSDALGTPGGHFVLNDCEDHFVWTSSAACPLVEQEKVDEQEQDKSFGDCRVVNPNTGYEFDLSSLRKDEGYTTYDRNGHEYNMNVCGWLNSQSKCSNGTGSCQVYMAGDKKSVNAGKANAHLSFDSGVLTLQYSDGETCSKKNVSRITYINFVCQPGEGNGVPVFIDSSDDCLYYFDWHTQLACEKEVKCSVDTPAGYTLDFSPLIKKTGKYNVIPSRAGGHQPSGLIYINLCRPLNPIFGTLCPAGSGACLVKDDNPVSLGHIDKGMTYDKNLKHTRIYYTNGDVCPMNKNRNITSVIILSCGTDENSEPREEGMSDDCEYLFLWETPHACEGNRTQKFFPNCSYFDHARQRAYDFSSLSELSEVKSSHGGTFSLQPCGGLKEKGEVGDTSCAGSAVCKKGSGSSDGSYGLVSHGLFQQESSFLQLVFSQGRQCGKGNQKRITTIYFYCDRSAGKGVPVIFEEEECEVTFRWMTSLICPPLREECISTNKGNLFDFSFLSRDVGSWNYTDENKNLYWLNLCESVHGKAITAGCPPEAAVCRKSSDGKINMLGRLDSQKVSAIGESPLKTKLVVEYTEGDPDACSSSRRRRSDLSPKVIVTLICGPTIGAPVLISTSENECEFNFVWRSKLACAVGFDLKPLSVKSGVVHDERTGKDVNLNSLLQRTSNIEIPVENKKFIINLGRNVLLGENTAETSPCKKASVCLVDVTTNTHKDIGTFSTGSFYMEDDRLEVVFKSSEKCSGRNNAFVSSTITFSCKEGETKSLPQFLDKSADCAYMFNWDTDVVCESVDIAILKPGTRGMGGINTSSKAGHSGTIVLIIVTAAVILVLASVLVLIIRNPQRRITVRRKLEQIILCRKSPDSPILYSRLSQADAGLDDPFNPFNEPDEENEIETHNLPPQAESFHDDSDEDMLL